MARGVLLFVSVAAFVSFVVTGGAQATGHRHRIAAYDDPTDVTLAAASGGRSLRIRIGGNGSGGIVELPVELYVARVLAAEGEPRAGDAAQQALAIVIRTFAAANGGRHGRDGFDLCDTTHCQVLGPATTVSRLAALATAGQLLTYAGRPAEVFYSASCGGQSEAASDLWPGATALTYLRSAQDDAHDNEEPWAIELPLASIEQALRRLGFEGRRLEDVRVTARSRSGRVTRLHLRGMRPEEIAGDDFRAALGPRELRSTQFAVRRAGRMLRFSGRGYGHGIGLCIVGAGRRAARGESVVRILDQYYPGLRIRPSTALADPPRRAIEVDKDIRAVPAIADQRVRRLRDEVAGALGIKAPRPITLVVHESLDAFRQATARPWWETVVVHGSSIDLAPLPVLVEQDGIEVAMRRGIAEALIADAVADRPVWVRVGAARYYARPAAAANPHRPSQKCPSDAELTMAVSAATLRDAERRAEACFARALATTGNWRDVR